MIYLDNSATTYPKPESVYEIVNNVTRQAFNAGRGSYKGSKDAFNIIEETRKTIASFTGSEGKNVVFSSSATTAINEIINGIDLKENDNVYVSPFEHNAVIRTLHSKNVNIIVIPFDNQTWMVKVEELQNMFALFKPKAVFVSQVSNVTGFEPDYVPIFAQSSKYNAINILDAAQGFGVIPITTKDINYIVFAGHKSLYGIFGVGGFIKLKNDILQTSIFGGTGSDSLNPNMPEEMPYRYEAGSENIIAIAALNEGAKWVKTRPIKKHEEELTKYLINELSNNKKVKLYIPKDGNVLGIVSISVDGYTAQDVADILFEEYEICVRAGYHCAPLVHDFINSKNSYGTVRISISAFTTKEEIDELIKAVNSL